jgi:hypothetical protein
MMQMRARSWCLRDAFPEVLKGMMLAEEAEAIPQSNGETIDPREEMDQSTEQEADNSPDHVEVYGHALRPSQADKLQLRDDALAEREGDELAAAIASVEAEMEDWPSDHLRSACDAMLDPHRDRLADQREESDGEPSETQDADEVKEAADAIDPEENEPEEFDDVDEELPF